MILLVGSQEKLLLIIYCYKRTLCIFCYLILSACCMLLWSSRSVQDNTMHEESKAGVSLLKGYFFVVGGLCRRPHFLVSQLILQPD